MRRTITLLALVATPFLTTVQALAADPPKGAPKSTPVAAAASTTAPAPHGLWLLTDYPSQTVRPGEVTTIRFKLQNSAKNADCCIHRAAANPAIRTDYFGNLRTLGESAFEIEPGNFSVSLFERNSPSAHAKSTNTPIRLRVHSSNFPRRQTKCLLVRAEERAEEVVVGRVRHQRLLTNVGGNGAAGSWSGSPVGV